MSPLQRSNPQLFGIVLASRESNRLKPFIKRLRGDTLPKQYASFTGTRSMLEHTYARSESLIAPKRLFTVVDHDHLNHREVVRQLRGRPAGTVVVQPQNKGSAAEILLPLLHIHKRYPQAVVALFPSDQFVWERGYDQQGRFPERHRRIARAKKACRAAGHDASWRRASGTEQFADSRAQLSCAAGPNFPGLKATILTHSTLSRPLRSNSPKL
jgi:hypothetical protein